MQKFTYKTFFVVGLAFSASNASAASLITNGGFEAPTVSGQYNSGQTPGGWTVDSGTIDFIGSYWNAQGGSAQSVDLNGNSAGTLSQIFSSTIGETYRVEFYQSYNPDRVDNSRMMRLAIDTSRLTSLTPFGGATPTIGLSGNMNWERTIYDFVATNASTKLSFSTFSTDSSNTSWGMALDSVSVTAIPEPGEWAMMIAGLGVVGLMVRRRRAS